MTTLVYFLVMTFGDTVQIFSTFWWTRVDLVAEAPYVSFMLAFLASLAAAGTYLSEPQDTFQTNQSDEQLKTFRSLTAGFTLGRRQISGIWLLAIVVGFMSWRHATDISWQLVFLHYEYLQTMTAQSAGISDPVAAFFHQTDRIWGMFVSILIPLTWRSSRKILTIVLTGIFLYILLHAVSIESRYAFVLVFILAATFQLTREKQGISPLSLILAVVSVALLVLALEMRRQPLHGLYAIYLGLKLSNFTVMDGFFMGIRSIFGGGLVFAASHHVYTDYPTSYKVLSLFPTLSSIDGFESIRDAAEVRIASYAPFNTYSEILHFGPLYQLTFYTFFMFMFKVGQDFRNKFGPISSIVVFAPAYLALPQSLAYQARPMIRMMLISVVLACLIMLIRKISQNRKSP